MNRYRVNRSSVHAGVLTLGLLSLCMLCYTNPKTTSEHSSNKTVIATNSPYAGATYYINQYLTESSSMSEPEYSSADTTKVGSPEESDSSEDDPSSESTEVIEEDFNPQEDNNEIPQDDKTSEENETTTSEDQGATTQSDNSDEVVYSGKQLNSYNGRVSGPSGSETYYNLNMHGCVVRMQSMGYDYEYWVRDDGVKMFGDYVMVAADFSSRPLGTILETSLGTAIVVDTGDFVETNPTGIDIAVTW